MIKALFCNFSPFLYNIYVHDSPLLLLKNYFHIRKKKKFYIINLINRIFILLLYLRKC